MIHKLAPFRQTCAVSDEDVLFEKVVDVRDDYRDVWGKHKACTVKRQPASFQNDNVSCYPARTPLLRRSSSYDKQFPSAEEAPLSLYEKGSKVTSVTAG